MDILFLDPITTIPAGTWDMTGVMFRGSGSVRGAIGCELTNLRRIYGIELRCADDTNDTLIKDLTTGDVFYMENGAVVRGKTTAPQKQVIQIVEGSNPLFTMEGAVLAEQAVDVNAATVGTTILVVTRNGGWSTATSLVNAAAGCSILLGGNTKNTAAKELSDPGFSVNVTAFAVADPVGPFRATNGTRAAPSAGAAEAGKINFFDGGSHALANVSYENLGQPTIIVNTSAVASITVTLTNAANTLDGVANGTFTIPPSKVARFDSDGNNGWEATSFSPPSFAAPVTVTGAVNAEGVADTQSRSDHQHRLELEGLDEGALQGARPAINFVGAGVGLVDNPGQDRLDVTIPGAVTDGAAVARSVVQPNLASTNGTTFVDGMGGLSVTIPIDGDYFILFEGYSSNQAASGVLEIGISIDSLVAIQTNTDRRFQGPAGGM